MTGEQRWALTALTAWFAITAAWWILALWPVADAPAWLERTRYVCFGVNENGLPDAGGWIGLIAGPIGMLLILLVGWSSSFRAVATATRRSLQVRLCVALLGFGMLFIISGATWRVREALAVPGVVLHSARSGVIPRINKPAPDLKLIAHNGEAFDLDDLRGRNVLITFAYAHCQTVCPVIVRQAIDAKATLEQTPHVAALVVVTLDPWRDTPSRLATMANAWELPGADAWIVGGTVDAVEKALDDWNIPRARDVRTGMITHPSLIYLIDKNGHIAFASTGGTATIVALARRL
jgi:cytochrome oxidase Cu insertion factor (SCO1/SenC/PrrC family)